MTVLETQYQEEIILILTITAVITQLMPIILKKKNCKERERKREIVTEPMEDLETGETGGMIARGLCHRLGRAG